MTEDGLDVVVVGAGAAGLMAARRLRSAGLRVVVLEARDRAGGRILTHRSPDLPIPIELGAEFLHGEAKRTRELLAEAAVDVVDIQPEQWEARGGAIGPARMWRDVERVLGRLDRQRRPDRSFAAFLASDDARGLSPDAIASASAFVEGFHAADLERVSERALAGEAGVEGALQAARVPTGYDRLIEHLAAPLRASVRLRHVVERIRWSEGRVTLDGIAHDGSFTIRARACVVSAPLALLASDANPDGPIRIDPPLDGIADAQRSVVPGDVVRIALVLEREPAALLRPGLPDPRRALDAEFFLHTPDEPFNVYWPPTPPSTPVLIAWAGGGRTAVLPPQTGAEASAEVPSQAGDPASGIAIEGIERATGLALGGALRRAVWHDWRTDPFSRGAYSYTVVGGTEPATPDVSGTLCFAGEAFAGKAIGTVEGALATGMRAADALVVTALR